jgi:hypothetical protein
VQRDIAIELFEERHAVTDQDRENGIADFVCQPATQTLAGDHAAADEPDASERGTQTIVDELREIARIELDRLPNLRQVAARENERRLVAVRQPIPFSAKRSAVS